MRTANEEQRTPADPAVHHGSVTAQELRHVLAGVPTGIVVVAAEVDDRIVGLSANSFTSISMEPPLVSISFGHTSTTWPLLRRATRWGISVLGEGQADVLAQLRQPAHERFDNLDMEVRSGAAWINGALATLTTETEAEIEAGDHVLTLLRVIDLARDTGQRPLIYFGSDTHRIAHRTSADVAQEAGSAGGDERGGRPRRRCA